MGKAINGQGWEVAVRALPPSIGCDALHGGRCFTAAGTVGKGKEGEKENSCLSVVNNFLFAQEDAQKSVCLGRREKKGDRE